MKFFYSMHAQSAFVAKEKIRKKVTFRMKEKIEDEFLYKRDLKLLFV